MESGYGKVLEQISRVLGAIDGLRRSVDEIKEELNSLASTIYASCFLEKVGKGKIVRSGLPSSLSFVVETEKEIFVVRAKIVTSYEDGIKVREVAEKLFLGSQKEIVPTLVTSKYKGHDIPSGVKVIIC